jgi:SAM-dependent methyltransferase
MPLSNLINLAISTQVEALMWTSTPTPPLLPLILTYLDPILDFLFILSHGLPSTLRYMLHHPFGLFSLGVWQSQLSAATQPWLLRGLDMQWAAVKRHILRDARGVVLEVGAGTGETIKYYCEREGQVERIFGVEPSLKKCGILKYTAKKLGMKDKYEVVPCGIEDVEGLKRYGIEYQSVDTVVCVWSFGLRLIGDSLFVQYS